MTELQGGPSRCYREGPPAPYDERNTMSFETGAAGAGRDAWEQAAGAQRGVSDPAHEDFYRYGGELVGGLTALEELSEVLSRQVAAYGNTRILRDDADGDPQQRLSEAAAHLDSLRTVLSLARTHANGYWSAIGHIGVEVDPHA